MKNSILLAAAILSSVFAKGQINEEHDFGAHGASMVLFTNYGKKILVSDTGQIQLLNADYTVWKSISIPQISGYHCQGASEVSDNLFSTDNLVEYVASYYQNNGNGTIKYASLIYNENGATVKDLDSTSSAYAVKDANGNYKLYTVKEGEENYSFHFDYVAYSLPGSLPCDMCGNTGVPLVNNQGNTFRLSSPVPNPTTGQTTIAYSLAPGKMGTIAVLNINGQQVGSYPVDANSTALVIQAGELPPGDYLYSLQTASGNSDTKKLVILK